jgi:hypothetical protein
MNALTLDLEDQTTWAVLPESYHVSLRSIAPYLAENKREAYPQITKELAKRTTRRGLPLRSHEWPQIFSGSKIAVYDIDLAAVRKIELFTYFSAPYPEATIKGLKSDIGHLHRLRHDSKILLSIHHHNHRLSGLPDRSAAVPIDRLALIFPDLRYLVEAGHKFRSH